MRNIPPPGHKRIRDWLNKRVKMRNNLINDYYRIPAGAVMTVTHVSKGVGGLHLESDPCACCGVAARIAGIHGDEVILLPDSEQRKSA